MMGTSLGAAITWFDALTVATGMSSPTSRLPRRRGSTSLPLIAVSRGAAESDNEFDYSAIDLKTKRDLAIDRAEPKIVQIRSTCHATISN